MSDPYSNMINMAVNNIYAQEANKQAVAMGYTYLFIFSGVISLIPMAYGAIKSNLKWAFITYVATFIGHFVGGLFISAPIIGISLYLISRASGSTENRNSTSNSSINPYYTYATLNKYSPEEIYSRISNDSIQIKIQGKIYKNKNKVSRMLATTPTNVNLDDDEKYTEFTFYPFGERGIEFKVENLNFTPPPKEEVDISITSESDSSSFGITREIERLNNLFKNGAITQEEYEILKKKVIES